MSSQMAAFRMMQFFGLVNERTLQNSETSNKRLATKIWQYAVSVLCHLYILLLVVTIFRPFKLLGKGFTRTLPKIFGVVLLDVMHLNQKKVNKVMSNIEMTDAILGVGAFPENTKFKRYAYFAIVTGVLLVIGMVTVCTMWLVVEDPHTFVTILLLKYPSERLHIFLVYLIAAANEYLTCVLWGIMVSVQVFYIVTCITLKAKFRLFNERIQMYRRDSSLDKLTCETLHNLCCIHNWLKQVIMDADDTLCHIPMLSCFMTFAVTSIQVTHFIIKPPKDKSTEAYYIASNICIWMFFFAGPFCASALQTELQKTLPEVQKWISSCKRLRKACHHDIFIFLQEINSPAVGWTFGGIFILDKGFIFSFISSLVSFSVMLIQLLAPKTKL